MVLTENDRNTIKYERRIAYIFSSTILAFLALFNLVYLKTEQPKNWIIFILVDLGMILMSILVSYFMNKPYNQDLADGTKIIKVEKIQKKEIQIDYEVGSGSLFIPILGNLFPKIWGQEMKEIKKNNLIINGKRYEVQKDFFEKVKKDDNVELHYSNISQILLGIETNNNLEFK